MKRCFFAFLLLTLLLVNGCQKKTAPYGGVTGDKTESKKADGNS